MTLALKNIMLNIVVSKQTDGEGTILYKITIATSGCISRGPVFEMVGNTEKWPETILRINSKSKIDNNHLVTYVNP